MPASPNSTRRQLLLGTFLAAIASARREVPAHGADPVDDLHAACVRRDVATVKRLLAADPKRVDEPSPDGATPLLTAVESGAGAIVRLLRQAGAQPDAAAKDGRTPRLVAVARLAGMNPTSPWEGAQALMAEVAVSIHAAQTPLREVLAQVFTAAHLPPESVDIGADLTEPVTATLSGDLDTAFSLLRRLARGGGQPLQITLTGGRLHVAWAGTTGASGAVGAVAAAATTAEEWPVLTPDPRHRFLGKITHPVLRRYLSRAVTHYGLCSVYPEKETRSLDDDLRMLTHLGAKFVGRAAYAWVPPDDDEAHFRLAAERATRVHQADAEVILQACVFEAVYDKVNRIPIPPWVFAEFGLPVETRPFRYDDMLYRSGKYRNHWTTGASVPDVTRRETQMYFYYRARRYIDAGFESVHWGQVHLMDEADPEHRHWFALLTRVRRYAARYARRQIVLCDAHTHGVVSDGGLLLFDLHAWPLMARDVKSGPASPQRVHLEVGYYNSIYRGSLGGITPSGWSCDSLPYICEFDCGGISDKPGQASDFPWNWGWSCGDWFAHQPPDYQREFLHYADAWLDALGEEASLQMPTRLNLAQSIDNIKMWQANPRSPACPDGFGLEDTIDAVWRAKKDA